METIEELEDFLVETTRDGIRNSLLDRGTAWALMRQQGELPDDAPRFGDTIETDLAEYGFSVLRAALGLKEARGSAAVAQRAFEIAASAFESLVRNGPPDAADRGFYRVIAAASYHLAGYSAIAYSLFNQHRMNGNVSPSEEALTLLILRDLDALRTYTRNWLLDEANSDRSLTDRLGNGELDADEMIGTIVNSTICRALGYFDFALQTGETGLLEQARDLLASTVRLADDAGAVSQWWIARLCLSLIGDLWGHSLHMNLPIRSPQGAEENYATLRELFLISLYGRKNAEIELWPSQLEAARRSNDVGDDLVVSLPTSAGKTRIAEMAALMALSMKKRVLIVTPLRALSAQTERLFRRTFAPLGFTVSSLYGASGISAGDEDALRSKDIVIATPEKLDFALRNDPALISDVGLIVLDEGHLIGPTEREIRYETLVQRLLRRGDSSTRRIVCLSAILPDGQQLNDLTEWIRRDKEGSAVKSQWRPTRQRFGSLIWQSSTAKLSFDLNDDGPYLARFVEQIPARGTQKKPLPRDLKDLTLFAAWNFAAQGKRTLIFLTQANWVEGYGKTALNLVRRGYLGSLLDDQESIARALEVGKEWLGDGHPAVESLKIGVAIHHGGLPNPFLRELEILLSLGVLKVVVASPTLSQGLNLNAAVLLVPSLYRSGVRITGEEFANVAGRAGRAFVDVEGLIVHVIYDRAGWRSNEWRKLIASTKSRTLKSGLIQIVAEIIGRLAQEGVLGREDAYEYLANSRSAWESENEEANVQEEDQSAERREPLAQLVEKLDATVFGLVEALDADSAELPRLLDEALRGSLWARQIVRETDRFQDRHVAILTARAQLIWTHTSVAARKGHFAMGVGLETGLKLDALAERLAVLVDRADSAALVGDEDALVECLVKLGRHLLVIRPFVPDRKNALPQGWEQLLKAWVTGVDVDTIGTENMGVIEDAFAYRLVWALEALRTRRAIGGWSSDIIVGGAAASLETGVPRLMMAMLIRAGLPSRRAASLAVREGDANFVDSKGMRNWLEGDEIARLTKMGNWPSPPTAALWMRFREDVLSGGAQLWRAQRSKRTLQVSRDGAVPVGIYRVEIDDPTGDAWICTPDYRRLVRLRARIRDSKPSFFTARFVEGRSRAEIQRIGRGRATWLVDGKIDEAH